MSNRLIVLAIERSIELGQIAYTIHQDLEKWRDPALTLHERAAIAIKLKSAIEEQRKWLREIANEMEKASES